MKPRILSAVIAVAVLGWSTGGIPLNTAATPGHARTVQPGTADTVSANLERAEAAFTEAQSAEAKAQQQAAEASQDAAAASAAAKKAAAAAERARGEYAGATKAADAAAAELSRLASYAYANNGQLSQLAQIGAALDPADFHSRSTSLTELLRIQDSLLQHAAVSQADAVNAAARANAQADVAGTAATQATARSEEAKKALAEASSAATKAEEALREVRRAYTASRQAAAERAAAGRNPDRGNRDKAPSAPPPSGDGVFQRPSTGPITSPYGMRVHPLTGVYKLHSGTDFGAPCGSGVHAAASGTVETTGYAGAYGNRVTVSHGRISGVLVTTTYNHLSAISVRPNQSVSAGSPIGKVGTTGSSTGCHLHFEVLVNGEFTNPMAWL